MFGKIITAIFLLTFLNIGSSGRAGLTSNTVAVSIGKFSGHFPQIFGRDQWYVAIKIGRNAINYQRGHTICKFIPNLDDGSFHEWNEDCYTLPIKQSTELIFSLAKADKADFYDIVTSKVGDLIKKKDVQLNIPKIPGWNGKFWVKFTIKEIDISLSPSENYEDKTSVIKEKNK